MSLEKELVDKLSKVARDQISTCLNFRQPRLTQIDKFIKLYNGQVDRQLKNRWNIPIPVLPGHVDTLMSKIDDAPVITYEKSEEADLKAAKKVTALFDRESREDRGNWASVDRSVKKLAIFSGYGTYKSYADSDPKYKSHLEAVDFFDFIFEPKGGHDSQKHIFNGQINIFRSRAEIEKGIKEGYYDKNGGNSILNGATTQNKEDVDFLYEEKNERYLSLDLDPISNSYVGDDLYNLAEHTLDFKGEKYYLFLEPHSGNVLRADFLKNVFANNKYPWINWHTNRDPFNFMSKGPLDDIYPVAEAMRVLFNEALNNLQKRGWNMRAFDQSAIKNPSLLKWKQDGLVPMDLKGRDIRSAIMGLQTDDNSDAVVGLMAYLDGFLGQKSGITAGAQGQADKDIKVGVYYGDLQQVADRLGLLNKEYKEAWTKVASHQLSGAKEHLSESYAVKIIGNKGVEWDEVKKNEIKEFDIIVTGGNAEIEANEVKKAKQSEALALIVGEPRMSSRLNTEMLMENILQTGEFTEDEIKRLMNVSYTGDDEIMAEAAQSIQIIIQNPKKTLEEMLKQNKKGESMLKINSAATGGFIQKILDFANDNEMETQIDAKLMVYAKRHVPIARRNMERKAQEIITKSLVGQVEGGEITPGAPEGIDASATPPEQIPQGTAPGTASRSQNIVQQLSPVT